jgi:hypothetical protein
MLQTWGVPNLGRPRPGLHRAPPESAPRTHSHAWPARQGATPALYKLPPHPLGSSPEALAATELRAPPPETRAPPPPSSRRVTASLPSRSTSGASPGCVGAAGAVGSCRRPLHRRNVVAGSSPPPPTATSSREPSSSLVSRLCCFSQVRFIALYIMVKSARPNKHPCSV